MKKKKYFQGGINMEMNDILNGLNSCDDSSSDSVSSDNCYCGGQNIGPIVGAGPLGGGLGCGFGSWIWILLILFYCGCGGSGFLGGSNGRSCGCNSCCNNNSCGCNSCCNNGGGSNGGLFGGMFGNCTAYLFLLVILFLCNNHNNVGCASPYGALNGYGANYNFGC